ncbi:hypothetical protein J1N35_037278 [Gossypium stocksii]|uniref:Large ribosomal subunit protein bL33c n=1 Tax=Gossypium stocksii TaxID=47602 RepID=A0A9D3UKI2_9ROSI|nr:hypothetical protein J1N35_037278 [Gossypium stocksii]
MGDKKKKTFMFIRLVSAAGTGFFYVKRKSAKKVAEKLEFRKYDPRLLTLPFEGPHQSILLFLASSSLPLPSRAPLGSLFIQRKSSC